MTPEDIGHTIVLNTTYVEVPVTVKDSKGKPIAGLTWRDFKVYENDTWEPLKIFTVDPASALDCLCRSTRASLRM